MTVKLKEKKMLRSPICWLGGKSLLRERIIKRFPNGYGLFVEVCAGGCWVLCGKEPNTPEVINDVDDQLIGFLEVVKESGEELIASFKYDLISRRLFQKYQDDLKNPEKAFGKVERAKRFWYILKNSFGGQRRSFGVSTTTPPKLNLLEVKNIITAFMKRLARVTIESMDFRKLIVLYDRVHTFFYIDPPYRTKTSRNYHTSFTDNDYIELRDLLRVIKGKFLLSINDDPFIRELFKEFKIEEVSTTYSVMRLGSKKVKELLIRNYD